MSPLGKFILNRADMLCQLYGSDIYDAAIIYFPNKTFFMRYMMVQWYAQSLGLEIKQSLY